MQETGETTDHEPMWRQQYGGWPWHHISIFRSVGKTKH